jgi:HPt (histidine-containing phosphotransfer) domain-containing protein
VLDQRLSQLSNDALRVLQTIALLDKLATPQLVKEILELETFRLLDAIEELSRANAMRDTEATIEAHQLLSKCALSKLSATSTLALRRRIGGLSQVSLDFE